MKQLIAKAALLGALAVSLAGAVSAQAAESCCVKDAKCCKPGAPCCK